MWSNQIQEVTGQQLRLRQLERHHISIPWKRGNVWKTSNVSIILQELKLNNQSHYPLPLVKKIVIQSCHANWFISDQTDNSECDISLENQEKVCTKEGQKCTWTKSSSCLSSKRRTWPSRPSVIYKEKSREGLASWYPCSTQQQSSCLSQSLIEELRSPSIEP